MEKQKVPTERTETKHGWHDGINEKQYRLRDLDLKILMPSLFSWKVICSRSDQDQHHVSFTFIFSPGIELDKEDLKKEEKKCCDGPAGGANYSLTVKKEQT